VLGNPVHPCAWGSPVFKQSRVVRQDCGLLVNNLHESPSDCFFALFYAGRVVLMNVAAPRYRDTRVSAIGQSERPEWVGGTKCSHVCLTFRGPQVSFAISGATLVLVYSISTLYHSMRGQAKDLFPKLDHQHA
jgi:hypothetical protein